MCTPAGDDTDYPIHHLADLFPRMDEASLNRLAEDIKDNGQREPITLIEVEVNGEKRMEVLDGRSRLTACRMCGKKPLVVEYDGNDPLGFVVSKNVHRRHLDETQRAMVAARLANLKPGSNQHTVGAEISATTQTRAGELLNVSRGSVQNAAAVLEKGDPELVAMVDAGQVAVSVAADLALLPKKEQRKAVAAGPEAAKAAAKEVREAKKAKGAKKRAKPASDLPTEPHELATGLIVRMEAVCREIDRLTAEVTELAADPLGRHIHVDSVTHSLREARNALWQSRPTEPCDRCGDDPPKPACKACYGTGRTIKALLMKGDK